MKQIIRLFALGMLLILMTGCMTFSGDKLSALEPLKPLISPTIEITVSKDYQYDIDVMQVITSNKDGRMVNKRVIETLWKDNGYISDSTYVKLGAFTSNADYNLTLSGNHIVDSSIAMQILSGLTLTIIPYTVDQEYNLVYKLELKFRSSFYPQKRLRNIDL
ncbi:MAG: hypothetical protein L3J75_05130 [Methylococcaceae bacterium]|nr:hypothetical protein [Methylococcaceae bacterium]